MSDSQAPVYREVARSRDEDAVVGGLLAELRTPRDEILRTRGRGDVSLYERTLRDDQVHACLQQRFQALVGREWQVEPGGRRRQDKKAADFIREQLEHVGFDDITHKMLHGIWFGYAVAEAIWAPDGTTVVLDDLRVRRPARFAFDLDGNLRLLKPGATRGEEMPARKFWTFSSGGMDHDDPYGRGLAYWAYWPVWLKRNVLRFWAIYAERFAAPLIKGTVPRGETDEEKNKLLKALRAAAMDSALVVPEGTQAELMEASARSGGDYQQFYQELNAAISKIVLSQTMTTDDGSSRAQADVHDRVKLEIVRSDEQTINESFNDQVVRWLVDWNFPNAAYPRVFRDVQEAEDLNARAERDLQITRMGFQPTQDYIDTTYGEGFEPAAGGAAGGQQHGQGGDQGQSGQDGGQENEAFAEPAEHEQQRDELTAQLDTLTEPEMTAWIDEIRRVIDTAEDLPTAIQRLEALYPKLSLERMAALIGDGLSVANLQGRAEIEDSADG